ncbi:MAG: ATP-binding protein [Dehalogenimonas sp.]|uniref:histidine kinase n=1 Tax=Candidatus Dehalogenimonas loeffleri TaxID=3127115 RepID=A0ABZ2J3K8_9CHLR|nr:ATP-binding protein [Dehalogenimonas sp.]
MAFREFLTDQVFPRRALAYLVTAVVVGLPYIAVVWLVGQLVVLSEHVWILVALFIFLAGSSWPVFRWALHHIDRIYYAGRYDYLKDLDEFIRETQSIANPEAMDNRVVELISGALECRIAWLLLPERDDDNFVVSACHPTKEAVGYKLRRQGGLVSWLEQQRKTVNMQEINTLPELQNLSSSEVGFLESLDARLVVPVAAGGGRLVGIIVVGPRLRGDYLEPDRRAVLALAGHLAVNLENARLYRDSQAVRRSVEAWLESMGDSVIIVNRDKQITFMNRSARRRFGANIGDTCYAVLGQKDPCENCPMPEVNARTRMPDRITFINNKYYEVAVAPLLEADGSYSFIQVLRDITERQLAAQALQQSERRFRTLAELLPSMVFVLKNGELTFANRRFEQASGYLSKVSLEDGYDIIQLFLDDCRPLVAQDLARRLAGEEIPPRECQILTADGIKLPVILGLEAFIDEHIVTVVGVLTDISTQKQAEADRLKYEKQANLAAHLASIGEMASGIAHEINNPLTAVIGFAQLLSQQELPESIVEDVEVINTSAQRVAGIVRRLMTFAGSRLQVREAVDVNCLVRETVELQTCELEHYGINLVTDMAEDLPPFFVDAAQIQQVFLNVIINAVTELKAKNQPRQLVITTWLMADKVAVSFSDNGSGIPEEDLKRVFDPFFTTREVGQGTGLGLSVCHGIVTQNYGQIYADNNPDGGAVFTVLLPVASVWNQE